MLEYLLKFWMMNQKFLNLISENSNKISKFQIIKVVKRLSESCLSLSILLLLLLNPEMKNANVLFYFFHQMLNSFANSIKFPSAA